MNNFRKHCALYIITFAHWCPQEGGKSRCSPSPGNYNTMGAFFLHVKYLFSPFEGPCFSFWRPFSLCVCGGGGGGVGGWGVPYVAKFLSLSPLATFLFGAHALAARVVANMAH